MHPYFDTESSSTLRMKVLILMCLAAMALANIDNNGYVSIYDNSEVIWGRGHCMFNKTKST